MRAAGIRTGLLVLPARERGAMTVQEVLRSRDFLWNLLIIATTALVLGANLAGLVFGITAVIPHVLYVPVVLASYRYPRYGLLFSAGIGIVYLLMVMVFQGWNSFASLEALVRAVVLTVIGGLVAFLTLRLRSQESLYQALFDNSEGGSILIRKIEGIWTVEEANWNAASLLRKRPEGLKGQPLGSFWTDDESKDILATYDRDGRVYAAETTLSTPDNGREQVLLSLASLPEDRAILTFVDITRRVAAEHALQSANNKLHLLSRISSDHLHRTVNDMIETLDSAAETAQEGTEVSLITKIRTLAWSLARQLFLTETYQDLGVAPPEWIPVQRILESLHAGFDTGTVSSRFWVERLEVFADPLFRDVMTHIIENSLRHGGKLKNLVVTYRRVPDGLDLVFEDDGNGIPVDMKEKIFEYDSGGHSGLGLFICRQILGVTGMTMKENGIPGAGARFVIHVPEENYRIEGTGTEAPPFPLPDPGRASARGARHKGGIRVQELTSSEFPQADELWIDYHRTTGDPATDRIFAAFTDGGLVSLGRCRRHPDGLEVDGIFTPERNRGHGYANAVVWGLIDATGHDTLYMHSVLNLTGFYGHYGFVAIPEAELPPTIKERFAWAAGEMEGANVCPMRRFPPSEGT